VFDALLTHHQLWLLRYTIGTSQWWYITNKDQPPLSGHIYRVKSLSDLPPQSGWAPAQDGVAPAPTLAAYADAASCPTMPQPVMPQPGMGMMPQPGMTMPQPGMVMPQPGMMGQPMMMPVDTTGDGRPDTMMPQPGMMIPQPGMVMPQPGMMGRPMMPVDTNGDGRPDTMLPVGGGGMAAPPAPINVTVNVQAPQTQTVPQPQPQPQTVPQTVPQPQTQTQTVPHPQTVPQAMSQPQTQTQTQTVPHGIWIVAWHDGSAQAQAHRSHAAAETHFSELDGGNWAACLFDPALLMIRRYGGWLDHASNLKVLTDHAQRLALEAAEAIPSESMHAAHVGQPDVIARDETRVHLPRALEKGDCLIVAGTGTAATINFKYADSEEIVLHFSPRKTQHPPGQVRPSTRRQPRCCCCCCCHGF
jgi:hypothetical protein